MSEEDGAAGASRDEQFDAFQSARYSAVGARRLQFDSMLWQVPQLSMAAHAFLLFGAVSGPTKSARILLGALSVYVGYLCAMLMVRQRQAEITDQRWLENFERAELKRLGHPDRDVPGEVFGQKFRDRRNAIDPDMGAMFHNRLFARAKAVQQWAVAELVFGAAGLCAIVLALCSSQRWV